MSPSAFDIAGKVALITGAGRGLGAALARAFAAAGAHLALSDQNEAAVRGTADLICAAGGRATAGACDVRDVAQVRRWVDGAAADFGRLDILINNAGINHPKPAEALTIEEWSQIVAVNLTGTFICCQAAGAVMLRQQAGAIVNICSIHGHVGSYVHNAAAYNASKAGIVNLTRSLALEWGDRGVRVNGISPGPLRTELMATRLADADYVRKLFERMALKRIGEPEDVAGAALFLASPAAAWITGQVLAVDGGWLAA